jgi:hypothetical protein
MFTSFDLIVRWRPTSVPRQIYFISPATHNHTTHTHHKPRPPKTQAALGALGRNGFHFTRDTHTPTPPAKDKDDYSDERAARHLGHAEFAEGNPKLNPKCEDTELDLGHSEFDFRYSRLTSLSPFQKFLSL